MKKASATYLAGTQQKFYLFTSFSVPEVLSSNTVFYAVTGEEAARTLCRLFCKEHSSIGQPSTFFLKSLDEVPLDEQILLDEAIDGLEVYDDPDPSIYDPPPPWEMLIRAEYARRARTWEARLAARNSGEKSIRADADEDQVANDSEPKPTTDHKIPEQRQMLAEDRRNSGLNLLFLLAQTYYKILESVISTATWCSALDLELNESYLWTITNLSNLLKNHEDLQDFPDAFEPLFHDLYPSTIRDVDWQDMVAPDVERFLSAVQRYVQSKGMYEPDESSPGRVSVEIFRSSIDTAIERAVSYNKRMRQYARRVLGADLSAGEIRKSGAEPEAPSLAHRPESMRIEVAPAQREDSRRPAPGLATAVDPSAISKPGEMVVDCGPLSAEDTDTTADAIELLQKLGFGAEAQEWPSSSFGAVLPNVLEQLKRAHRILATNGFLVVDDPLNLLGDGKSWALRCEPTNRLPNDSDPADLAQQYLEAAGVKVAAKPVHDGQTLLVPLWDSGRVYAAEIKPQGSGRITQQTSALNSRTPYAGLKPETKTIDYSDAMLAAKLTDKQYDCYSLVKEYQRPMNEVEQRMGITRKTIHEHVEAAETAMKRVSLKEYRAKAAAKRKRPE